MNKITVTFDKSLKREILEIFDKTTNEEGMIVEKSNTSQKVITPDGEEIQFGEFAGVAKGSEVFIKSDLVSLIRFSERENKDV